MIQCKLPGPAPSGISTTRRPVTAGDINSNEIGLLLQMKHDEGVIQAILEKIKQDHGLVQIILDKAKDFEHGITSHGDLCTSKCEKHHGYSKCNKKAGGVIERNWDFCSTEANVTHHEKVV